MAPLRNRRSLPSQVSGVRVICKVDILRFRRGWLYSLLALGCSRKPRKPQFPVPLRMPAFSCYVAQIRLELNPCEHKDLTKKDVYRLPLSWTMDPPGCRLELVRLVHRGEVLDVFQGHFASNHLHQTWRSRASGCLSASPKCRDFRGSPKHGTPRIEREYCYSILGVPCLGVPTRALLQTALDDAMP